MADVMARACGRTAVGESCVMTLALTGEAAAGWLARPRRSAPRAAKANDRRRILCVGRWPGGQGGAGRARAAGASAGGGTESSGLGVGQGEAEGAGETSCAGGGRGRERTRGGGGQTAEGMVVLREQPHRTGLPPATRPPASACSSAPSPSGCRPCSRGQPEPRRRRQPARQPKRRLEADVPAAGEMSCRQSQRARASVSPSAPAGRGPSA